VKKIRPSYGGMRGYEVGLSGWSMRGSRGKMGGGREGRCRRMSTFMLKINLQVD